MDRNEIEAQVRQILREETKAIALSNKLFRPDGLFARLAATEAERRVVSNSPLFQEAQDRLSELQQAEMDEFRKAIAAVGDRLPGGLVSYRSEELTAGK